MNDAVGKIDECYVRFALNIAGTYVHCNRVQASIDFRSNHSELGMMSEEGFEGEEHFDDLNETELVSLKQFILDQAHVTGLENQCSYLASHFDSDDAVLLADVRELFSNLLPIFEKQDQRNSKLSEGAALIGWKNNLQMIRRAKLACESGQIIKCKHQEVIQLSPRPSAAYMALLVLCALIAGALIASGLR